MKALFGMQEKHLMNGDGSKEYPSFEELKLDNC